MPAKPCPPPAPSPRTTLTEVARRAGVSLMTASYAMRNHPKIPPVTRNRVQRVARRIGYIPNPEISRLMHLLRARRMTSFQATLAFLSFHHGAHATTHRYTADVIVGAKKRAAELGYSVDVLSIEHTEMGRARLTTMLKSRGIRGVLIPPLPEIADCSEMLDWSQFSIIAATYSAQNLFVNRVMPHHQNNILQAILHLRRLGYRRPGFVFADDLVYRANFAYHAALALHQQAGDFVAIPALNLAPGDHGATADSLRPWLRAHRPDVLLTVENVVPLLTSVLGASYPEKVGICVLDHSGSGPMAGIHQHPAIIGGTAVELLASQIVHGELGFGRHPCVTMVEGAWIPGRSIRSEAPEPKPPAVRALSGRRTR
jgi:LacI family transcriptional regulator